MNTWYCAGSAIGSEFIRFPCRRVNLRTTTMSIERTREAPRSNQTSKEKYKIKRVLVFPLPRKPGDFSKKYTNDRYRDSIPKPEDLGKSRPVSTDQSNVGLWEQAWEQVKNEVEDWKLWPQLQGVKNLKTKDAVEEVHVFAQRRRDEAEENQRHVFDTSLIYRKMCTKVAKCAKDFRIVGDMVTQAEPVYAALPWVIMSVLEHPLAMADTQ